MPEVRALIKIMQFAFPYQYNQKPLIAKIFFANFAVRILLNKLLPKFFNKPAFYLIQDHTISYTEILKKSHSTTKRLASIFGLGFFYILLSLITKFSKFKLI